ncbi:MAG: PilZ domain-containing protein [Methylococcales bacterium]|nr:PilZ domain-containing protein [Methylococcales bacterium]
MLEYNEKRDFIRMNVECPLHFKLPGHDTEGQGLCTSLSGSGLSFLSAEPLTLGLAVEVTLDPKNNITPPMHAFVEIIRCEATQDGRYDIGAVIKTIKGD